MFQISADLGCIFGKFMTDGVWWFFLFWAPAYISDVYGFSSDTPTAQMLIFVLYAITMLSVYGGKLPTIIINKTGKNPYAARMQACSSLHCSRYWHCLHSHWATRKYLANKLLVPDYHHRYCRRCPSVLVGQHLFCGR